MNLLFKTFSDIDNLLEEKCALLTFKEDDQKSPSLLNVFGLQGFSNWVSALSKKEKEAVAKVQAEFVATLKEFEDKMREVVGRSTDLLVKLDLGEQGKSIGTVFKEEKSKKRKADLENSMEQVSRICLYCTCKVKGKDYPCSTNHCPCKKAHRKCGIACNCCGDCFNDPAADGESVQG